MEQSKQVTFTFLKELNEEIKSHDSVRQDNAYNTLIAIDLKGLNPGLIMYIHYLKGKYHYLNFKRNDSLKSIEQAVTNYQRVFQTARHYRVHAKNPKYHFKYAESMHKLSLHVFCLFEQNRLHNTAYQIAIHGGKRFPDNSSLKWLQRHILGS